MIIGRSSKDVWHFVSGIARISLRCVVRKSQGEDNLLRNWIGDFLRGTSSYGPVATLLHFVDLKSKSVNLSRADANGAVMHVY